MADIPKKDDSPEQRFLGFIYPEIKDLSKQFLALISAILAFCLTFADKIINLGSATIAQKQLITAAIIVWVLAAIMTGCSLVLNFVAAARILDFHLLSSSKGYRGLVKASYIFLDCGGFFFVGGLILMSLAGISKIY